MCEGSPQFMPPNHCLVEKFWNFEGECWLSPTESQQILTESALHCLCLPTLPLSASLNRCGYSSTRQWFGATEELFLF